jgi:hypothetical protein
MLGQMGRVCGRPDYISWLICTTGLCGNRKGRVGTAGGIGEAVYVVEAVGWESAPAPLLLPLLPIIEIHHVVLAVATDYRVPTSG